MLEMQKERTVCLPATLTPDAVDAFWVSLGEAVREGSHTILVDCSRLEQVVSSHVNLLWQTYERCTEKRRTMRLHRVSDGLTRVLQALDLHEFFPDESQTQPVDIRAVQGLQSITAARSDYVDAFQADGDETTRALDRFMSYLEDMRLSDTLKFELRTVFYEVATNIRTHALLREHDSIRFEARSDGERIMLKFSDEGIPFDLTSQPQVVDFRAAARRGQRRGFGIAMISQLSDRLTYNRENGTTNVLTVEKNWSR